MRRFLGLFSPQRSGLTAFGLGGLLVFAHAPIAIAPLALISLAGLFWFWQQAKTLSESIKIGFWFGLGFFGVGVSWLISSMYFYAEMNLLVSALATLVFVLFLTLFIMLAGAMVFKLKQTDAMMFNWVLVMPAVWVFAEWLRATLFGGFPFLMTGNTHLLTWLDGYAPVFGVLGISWAVALSAGILLWLYGSRAWLGASFLLATLWLSGAALKSVEWVEPKGKTVDVALLQGNIPQDKKWLSREFMPTLKTYVGMTKQNLDADLIVWPETAVPAYYDLVEKGALRSFIKDAQLLSTDILMGVITRDQAKGKYFNAIVNAHNPKQQYHKKHLVPFSEFFPFSGLFKSLSLLFDIPFSEFTPGAKDQEAFELAGHKVGLSVCYEMAFGEELTESAKASDFLVTVSNDAWFAHTLEPAQQVQDVQMRALELGREIARSTNTGFTILVGVNGVVKAEIPAYKEGVLRTEVQPYQGETPFIKWRQWPILLLLLAVLLLVVGFKLKHQTKLEVEETP